MSRTYLLVLLSIAVTSICISCDSDISMTQIYTTSLSHDQFSLASDRPIVVAKSGSELQVSDFKRGNSFNINFPTKITDLNTVNITRSCISVLVVSTDNHLLSLDINTSSGVLSNTYQIDSGVVSILDISKKNNAYILVEKIRSYKLLKRSLACPSSPANVSSSYMQNTSINKGAVSILQRPIIAYVIDSLHTQQGKLRNSDDTILHLRSGTHKNKYRFTSMIIRVESSSISTSSSDFWVATRDGVFRLTCDQTLNCTKRRIISNNYLKTYGSNLKYLQNGSKSFLYVYEQKGDSSYVFNLSSLNAYLLRKRVNSSEITIYKDRIYFCASDYSHKLECSYVKHNMLK